MNNVIKYLYLLAFINPPFSIPYHILLSRIFGYGLSDADWKNISNFSRKYTIDRGKWYINPISK